MGRPKIYRDERKPIYRLFENFDLDDSLWEDTDKICDHCKYSHCDWYKVFYKEECPLAKKKTRNKYTKLQKYVYENLTYYGNTIVSDIVYNALGEDGILADLKAKGFDNVEIKITNDETILLTRKR